MEAIEDTAQVEVVESSSHRRSSGDEDLASEDDEAGEGDEVGDSQGVEGEGGVVEGGGEDEDKAGVEDKGKLASKKHSKVVMVGSEADRAIVHKFLRLFRREMEQYGDESLSRENKYMMNPNAMFR